MAIAPPVQTSERVRLLPGSVNVVLVGEGRRALVIDGRQAHPRARREAGVLHPRVVDHRLVWGPS